MSAVAAEDSQQAQQPAAHQHDFQSWSRIEHEPSKSGQLPVAKSSTSLDFHQGESISWHLSHEHIDWAEMFYDTKCNLEDALQHHCSNPSQSSGSIAEYMAKGR